MIAMKENMQKEIASSVLGEIAQALKSGGSFNKVSIGLTNFGTEVPAEDLVKAAKNAMSQDPGLDVVVIGDYNNSDLRFFEANSEEKVHETLEQLLDSGEIDGVVTMHYPFPIGVSTVGKVITPARGKSMYIATTTGTSDKERIQAMVKNAVYGIAVAKADGLENPTVGILNVDSARQVERQLNNMKENGYQFSWGESQRSDGGHVLRGNDLIMGSVDVLVTDTLTGNILMKLFSSFNSGGDYETNGYGYGPGVGEDFDRLICILSRASGTPVVSNAIQYCASMVRGKLSKLAKSEIAKAKKADWTVEESKKSVTEESQLTVPPEKVTDASIGGIDILELDDAVAVLWKDNIYASTGMGCTGPVILIASEDRDKAVDILKEAKFLG